MGQISLLICWILWKCNRFIGETVTRQSWESHGREDGMREYKSSVNEKRERGRTVPNEVKSGLLSFIHLKCKSKEADTQHPRLSPPLFPPLICIERTAGFVWRLRLMSFMELCGPPWASSYSHMLVNMEELWAKARQTALIPAMLTFAAMHNMDMEAIPEYNVC